MAQVPTQSSISVVIDMEVEDNAAGLLPAPSSDDGSPASPPPEDSALPQVMCEICYLHKPRGDFVRLSACGHSFCAQCVRRVFETSVMQSRVNLQCLRCSEGVPQHEIRQILDAPHYEKYLSFTLRKYLAKHEPNCCYCLAPNCPFACINSSPIIPSHYAERNHFVCGREECLSEFCNRCKMVWHPDKTCAEFERDSGGTGVSSSQAATGISSELRAAMGTKNCPSCGVVIEKMTDGSCNQVVCSFCQTSFCWLCGKRVTEMHYMSPTGCPLYGSTMWTRKRSWCCRLWLWILAPLLTCLTSLIILPVVLIVFPLGIGYKVYKSCKDKCHKVCGVITTVLVVTLCVLMSPLVAFLASILVVPLMLLYFYCFIPIHLCIQSSSSSSSPSSPSSPSPS